MGMKALKADHVENDFRLDCVQICTSNFGPNPSQIGLSRRPHSPLTGVFCNFITTVAAFANLDSSATVP